MAVPQLPSFANIAETRLWIDAPAPEARRPANLRAPYAARFSELWRAQVLFAAMSRNDAHRLKAFFSGLDGRVQTFQLPLPAGYLTREVEFTGQLNATPASGRGTINVARTGGATTLAAGTLLAIGNINADDFQLVEVLADAEVSAGSFTLEIAPRIARVFPIGTVVQAATFGKFALAKDVLDGWAATAGSGTLAVDLIEAP